MRGRHVAGADAGTASIQQVPGDRAQSCLSHIMQTTSPARTHTKRYKRTQITQCTLTQTAVTSKRGDAERRGEEGCGGGQGGEQLKCSAPRVFGPLGSSPRRRHCRHRKGESLPNKHRYQWYDLDEEKERVCVCVYVYVCIEYLI